MAVNTVANQKTLQQIIDSTATDAKQRNTGELGKDDFLNLLVTQLRYQDPLQPVDDKEFIGQMAQFSSLEQMQNMNVSLTQSQAFSLIGKHVTGQLKDSKTGEMNSIEGNVTSVKMSQGKAYVIVKGQDIPVESVTDVTEGAGTSASLSNYTNLIGYNADGSVYDPATGDIINVNGVVKGVQAGTYEDYAVMDGVEVEVADISTTVPSTDPNFKLNYLEEHKGGKDASLVIVDRTTDKKVPVNAKLRSYTVSSDGKTIKAILDQVNVPVESISRLKPAQ